MPLRVNLRLLERKPLRLVGDLPAGELAAGFSDELVRFADSLHHDFEVTRQGTGLFLEGELATVLECNCSRCLQPFRQALQIKPWSVLAPLEGEDALERDGDFADLTPLLREDTFLALPTKPLCKPECRGLASKASARDFRLEAPPDANAASPWAALDKLKL